MQELSQRADFDQEAFLAAHQQAAPTSVRLNPAKPSGLFESEESVPWCSNGRYLKERPVFTKDPLFHAGAYYVQEASSMFLDYLLKELMPVKPGLRVLDLSAAPGGKSTLIASLLEEDSLLVCNEVIRTRASILEENVTRWGHMNTWVTCNDPKDFKKLTGYFDVVVVDAPCSGSGLFRKDEKAINEWSEANVGLCAERQKRILADIWPSLKEGGLLVYSTCSYSQKENEGLLDWVAEELSVSSLSVDLNEEWGIQQTTSDKGLNGYRFFPHKLKGEGFFIAAFKKQGTAKEVKRPKLKIRGDKKIKEQSAHLLDGISWSCLSLRDEYVAVHNDHISDLQLLEQHTYLRKVGVALGAPSKKEWLPAHDIALSIHRSKEIATIELDKEQALKFLKKDEFSLSDLPKGWYVVCYKGQGLGWIKALGSRVNNYLPKHWRIRMNIDSADWA